MLLLALKLFFDYRALLKAYQLSAQTNLNQPFEHLFEQQFFSICYDEYDTIDTNTTNNFIVVNRTTDYLTKSASEFMTQHEYTDMPEFVAKQEQYITPKKKSQKRPVTRKSKKPGVLRWPIEQSLFWLSSRFGPRKKENGTPGFHYGIDMAAAKGTPVKAAGLGEVIEATYNNGYGKTIVIAHGNGFYQTRYAHLDTIEVKRGKRVVVGQKIGTVGDTGSVRGENGGKNAYHLHFEVKLRGKHIDPLRVLPTKGL